MSNINCVDNFKIKLVFEKAYERLKTEFEVVVGDKAKVKMDKALKRIDPNQVEATQ